MSLTATSVRDPFFIDHKDRRLFAVYHPAACISEARGGVVFFAPFAEEPNRTRKLATLLAEGLSPRHCHPRFRLFLHRPTAPAR